MSRRGTGAAGPPREHEGVVGHGSSLGAAEAGTKESADGGAVKTAVTTGTYAAIDLRPEVSDRVMVMLLLAPGRTRAVTEVVRAHAASEPVGCRASAARRTAIAVARSVTATALHDRCPTVR